MHFDGQTIVVLIVVAAALVYVLRGAWLTFARKKSGGCGGCAKCPATQVKTPGDGFVSLDSLGRMKAKK